MHRRVLEPPADRSLTARDTGQAVLTATATYQNQHIAVGGPYVVVEVWEDAGPAVIRCRQPAEIRSPIVSEADPGVQDFACCRVHSSELQERAGDPSDEAVGDVK